MQPKLFQSTGLTLFSKIRPKDYFYSILFLSYFLMFLYMRIEVIGSGLRTAILSALADSSLLFLLSLCFLGKWKIIVLAFPVILSLIIFSNCLYDRYFHTLISPSMYVSPSVFNLETFKGAAMVFYWKDLCLFILSLSPTIFFIVFRRKGLIINNAGKWFLISDVAIIVFSWTMFTLQKFEKKGKNEEGIIDAINYAWHNPWNGWKFTYNMFNFTGYIIQGIQLSSFNSHIFLSEEDRAYIKQVLLKNEKKIISSSTDKPENLIFIVVESFPAKLMESDLTSTVLPNISKLVSDSTAIYFPVEVIPYQSNSSTAQFIYNTGLLPLRNEVVALNYSLKDYPSIARAKKWHTLEVIGERGGMWNHFQTSQSYGYDKLIENVASEGNGQDSLIFKVGIKQLSKLSNPFFLFLTTLTMHAPYTEKKVENFLPSAILGTDIPEEIEYYNRAHFFDRQFGFFLHELTGMEKYDKTSIVLIGDHPIPDSAGVPSLEDTRIPLIIIHPPSSSPRTDLATQADIFPTILDIMGQYYEYRGVSYRGFGKSIFDKSPYRPLTDEDFKVSEMIIKGDF